MVASRANRAFANDRAQNERNAKMTKQEFEKRTAGFIEKSEIDRYEECFEPAYMAVGCVDKDDFCAMLKDEATRKFVREVSRVIRTDVVIVKDAIKEQQRLRDCVMTLNGRNDKLRKALSLISANCDRALKASSAA